MRENGYQDATELALGTKAARRASPLENMLTQVRGDLLMNSPVSKDTLIGEEWMALRQIALGVKAAAIPRSVRTRLEVLDLITRDDYGHLMLTEKGRRLITEATRDCRFTKEASGPQKASAGSPAEAFAGGWREAEKECQVSHQGPDFPSACG